MILDHDFLIKTMTTTQFEKGPDPFTRWFDASFLTQGFFIIIIIMSHVNECF